MLNFGEFRVRHFRDGRVVETFVAPNAQTSEGIDYSLEAAFRGGTQETNWYLGLVDSEGFTGFASSDTMSSHPGWIEFTRYVSPTRPQLGPWVSAGVVGPNQPTTLTSTIVEFDLLLPGVINGFFIASDNAKLGTAGVLWATAPFIFPGRRFNFGGRLCVEYSSGYTFVSTRAA